MFGNFLKSKLVKEERLANHSCKFTWSDFSLDLIGFDSLVNNRNNKQSKLIGHIYLKQSRRFSTKELSKVYEVSKREKHLANLDLIKKVV